MNNNVLQAVEGLANTKRIDKTIVFHAIQEGLASASKKHHSETWDIRVSIDQTTGDYITYRRWQVTEDAELEHADAQIALSQAQQQNPAYQTGEFIEEEIDSIEFSRIASNHAIPVIKRKIQEAARQRVVEQFRPLVGELVQGTVKKVSRESVIVDLGDDAEAILPRSNMIPREEFRMNDRLKAMLLEISEDTRGPQLILDRTKPEMLRQLFRIEVPEISEGIIEIQAAARIAGSRAKISVSTVDGRIDPVGACVGMRGSRVQAVSNQICNERIDIVPWDENPIQLAVHAMAPAKAITIMADEDNYTLDVAVSDDDLSQAIGRYGENVRLVEDLTGWKLNIMTEDDAAKKQEDEAEQITQHFIDAMDVDEDMALTLLENQFELPEEIADANITELQSIEGFDDGLAQELQDRAKAYVVRVKAEAIAESKRPAQDLLDLPGMSEEIAVQLAEHGITTRSKLADLAVFELQEMIEDLEDLNDAEAGKLIMAARDESWLNEQLQKSETA